MAEGLTLTIPATAQGTATNITFGTGLGQVATLNQLNAALAPNFLLASIDTTGRITITTSNDAASETIGTIGGTATGVGEAFNGLTAGAPVTDPTVQTQRANLVAQYNKIIENITTTSQDASFNGINLLAGDTLKLVFNETGKSVLNIQGVNFTPAGLGLGNLTSGTDFIDNNRTNLVLTSLEQRRQLAALAGGGTRFEPVDRADPSGVLQEPDQRAANRIVRISRLPTPTKRRRTARRWRRVSRSRSPRSRSPTSRSRACCSCCAKRNERQAKRRGKPRRFRAQSTLAICAYALIPQSFCRAITIF